MLDPYKNEWMEQWGSVLVFDCCVRSVLFYSSLGLGCVCLPSPLSTNQLGVGMRDEGRDGGEIKCANLLARLATTISKPDTFPEVG